MSQFVDYSFEVPVLGGTQRIIVNVLDVVHAAHCPVCERALAGAIVAIGSPYSTLLHRECMNNFDYTRPWQHRFPAAVYREQALATHFPAPSLNTPAPQLPPAQLQRIKDEHHR